MHMKPNELIDLGNQHREQRLPEQALACYAQAFVQDRTNAAAFNNYGNVLREVGDPAGAIPFLERALTLEPRYTTAKFNIAVCQLLLGDYKHGWASYESRWEYEHLAGTLPKFEQPRWQGEPLKDKTILVIGEQGHGDTVQFVRFVQQLIDAGANVLLQVTAGLVSVFQPGGGVAKVGTYTDDLGPFDYWTPIMSIPRILGITLDNLPRQLSYISADSALVAQWAKRLGFKNKMRVGFGWSGRRDSWLNGHKGMPFNKMIDIIKRNPDYNWINLQADATDEENQTLTDLGVTVFPGTVSGFADTAALMMHLDIVLSVDTVTAHLAGSLGRPTWIMLNDYAVDWRWLLGRNSTPWYPSAVLFRQEKMDDWESVIRDVTKHLGWAKI